MTWYGDEILVCEGDLVGEDASGNPLTSFRRDRDWLKCRPVDRSSASIRLRTICRHDRQRLADLYHGQELVRG